jgi:glucosamine kinase
MPINILVGDIGSTKSTWWSNSAGNNEFLLTGYNPITHDDSVGKRLFEQLWQVMEGESLSKIWYYGTGILDEQVAEKVIAAMKSYFPNAEITVQSDLLGAAIAACGHQEGVLAILGTGSHAAIFDGSKIIRQASSLGYLLGDEGGGSDIGKELVKAYFYKQMPDEMAVDMKFLIHGDRSEFLQKLYQHPTPNQFLAEFVKVAVQHQEDPWMQNLITNRFTLFIKNHLLSLHPNTPIQVVGSVGTIFAGLFRKALENNHLLPGVFIKDPARRLFEMHLQHE